MKKIMLFLVLFTSISTIAQVKVNKNASYTFEVKGNCEMCKKRIENAAFTVKGVKNAVWDIAKNELQIIINEQKCSVTDVKKAVAKVGHDTDEVKATDEEYNKLHGCCIYDR